MVLPNYDQQAFRFRDGVPDPSGVNAAFDASDSAKNADTSLLIDTLYRVRFVVQQTNKSADDADDLATEFRLQYNNVTSGSGWANVGDEGTGTEGVEFDTPSGFGEGDATTQLLGTGTFISGRGCYDSITGTCSFTASAATETEIEFSIRINGPQVDDGDEIQLRVFYSKTNESPPSTVLAFYTETPTITVDASTTLTTTRASFDPSFGSHDLKTTLDPVRVTASPSFGTHELVHVLTPTGRFDTPATFGGGPLVTLVTALEQTSRFDIGTTIYPPLGVGELVALRAEFATAFGFAVLDGGYRDAALVSIAGDRSAVQLPRDPRRRSRPTTRSRSHDERRDLQWERALRGLPRNAIEGSLLMFWDGEWRLLAPDTSEGLLSIVGGKPEWQTISTEQEYVWFADFLIASPSQNGWSNAASGGSLAGHWDALIDTSDNGVGVVQLQTGTGTTGYYSLCTYNDKFVPAQGQMTFEARLCPEVVSDATNEYNLFVGFGQNVYSAALGTHECAFVYRRATLGNNWFAITRASGSETQVDTGVACTAAVLQKLKIVLSADGVTATFYIDGVLVATITTNMPTARMGLSVGIFKTAGTTQRELWVDWTRFRFRRATPR